MRSKITLHLPADLAGLRAPAAILDENFCVIERTMMTNSASPAVYLDAGIYAARAILPNGRAFEAAFRVEDATASTAVMLKTTARDVDVAERSSGASSSDVAPRAPGQLWANRAVLHTYLRGFEADGDVFRQLSAADAAPDAAPTLSVVSVDGSGRMAVGEAPPALSAGTVTIEQQASSRFLCIEGPRGPAVYIAAPTSETESVTFHFPLDNPTTFQVALDDDRADALLSYFERGRVEQLALFVADYWDKADGLLAEQLERPIGATVGAYVIATVGPPAGASTDDLAVGNWVDRWTEDLFERFPWLTDGRCIRAELLARRGAHLEALQLLLALPECSLPMFSLGLRFALDRLSGYRNAAASGKLDRSYVAEIDRVLDALYPIVDQVDFDQKVVTFTRPASGDTVEARWPREPERSSSFPTTGDTSMPNNINDDDVRPRDEIPHDALAKEFDEEAGMDDSAAYLEEGAGSLDAADLFDAPNWRAAKSLKQLQQQVNAAFPGRSKASDGMIGDTAHCPGSSDHCPNIADGGVGVVTAYDITHDPAHGCDMAAVTKAVIESRDSRIKYIIYNHKICSSYDHSDGPPWSWRPYSGSNAHTKHAHFSVLGTSSKYDDTADWSIGA